MPIVTKRTILIKNQDGQITKLTEQDQISEQIEVEVTCAGPRCGKSNPDGLPTRVAWDSDQVKDSPDSLPDPFYRLLTLIPNPQDKQQLVFCCATCVKDYLTYVYVKPQSPRELALAAINNEKADERHHKVLPFELPTVPPLDKTPEPSEGNNDRS